MISHVPARSIHIISRRTALAGLGAGVLTALALQGRTATAQDAVPAPSEAVGLTMQLLGGGAPASAPGLELTLRRTVLAPGARLPDHTHPGALVILVEAGTFGYTALGGTARLTRAPLSLEANREWYRYADVPLMRAPGVSIPAEDIPLGTGVLLAPGDWLFVEDPQDDIRNAGRDDVVLLVAGLTRVGEPFTTVMADMDMMATPAP